MRRKLSSIKYKHKQKCLIDRMCVFCDSKNIETVSPHASHIVFYQRCNDCNGEWVLQKGSSIKQVWPTKEPEFSPITELANQIREINPD